MKLLKLREAVSRVVFWGQNIRYLSRRHYMVTVFLFLFIMVIIFTSVFIGLRREIQRKENVKLLVLPAEIVIAVNANSG